MKLMLGTEDITWQVGSWQHWADLLPTNTEQGRPYQPITESPSDGHISPQSTWHVAECTPSSRKNTRETCLLPRRDCWPFPTAFPTARQHRNQTNACPTNDTQHTTWIHLTTQLQRTATYSIRHSQPWTEVTWLSEFWWPNKSKGKNNV